MTALNETHDASRRSWVESANHPETDFPLQNLPFGIFTPEGGTHPRAGVAIGDRILDVAGCLDDGYVTAPAAAAAEACRAGVLNPLMALDGRHASALRRRLWELLADSATLPRPEHHLHPMAAAKLALPVAVGDYTDFYASIHHATNVGLMLRPDNPLLANYKHVPIAYHGRASSIVASGTPILRPSGQTRPAPAAVPAFGPCRMLDYECEVGLLVGPGNTLGSPIPIDDAESHIFGFCLVNDWSARDIQAWEYQPLGPFLGKSFATSISPWVVTLEALAPFRAPRAARPADDPEPLSYLDSPSDRAHGAIAITLEVHLSSATMAACRLSRADFRHMYWTPAQMLAHHSSNGCNLRPGDLLASGTVSGPEKLARGCLLELTWRGAEPVDLPRGETRRFIEDGDEVILTGWSQRDGFRRIGFGECRGVVVPARPI